ncbi:MAG: HAMP domain-containing histidine kinase [Oscillospiraceae bacterium]|nr:HAMP domain-containing histidine kinase [Oscillospiraceae bacterium]
MRGRAFFVGLFLVFAAELAMLVLLMGHGTESPWDTVAVNEIVQTVQRDWDSLANHVNDTEFDYVVLGADGTVLYRTRPGLSESMNAAIAHKDTMLDVEVGGMPVGKLIIYNDDALTLQSEQQTVVFAVAAAMLLQLGICAGYFCYLRRTVVAPFRKLEQFAQRVAGGNLDIPLKMDRHNLFGAFTESFDLMRAELKKARLAEAKAAAAKKELVAKLSHDIKTPVASIKAASEVGAARASDDKNRENYWQITQKADQINTLVTNLFSATLEELHELTVTPSDIKSEELRTLLENADYLHRSALPNLPDCLLYADRLRLQQVFDNIFANSYKYAGTDIDVAVELKEGCLTVCVEDYGGGVSEQELPHLKEKFKRGGNAKDIEGAGLGLYISDHCMREMGGRLELENGASGLKVTVWIALSHGI